MRGFALSTLMLLQVTAGEPPRAQPAHMRYMRAVSVPAGAGQACAALDAQVFPHSEPALKDLRLFTQPAAAQTGIVDQGFVEVPFVITLSEAATEETQPAQVLNLGTGPNGAITFDLRMPDRPYTDVLLDLDGHDFLATVRVEGLDSADAPRRTELGTYTLFDLSAQHLSRDTTLPLPESTFRTLHVSLAVTPAPGSPALTARFPSSMVEGAYVPPSREAETVYTTVAAVQTPTGSAPASTRTTRFDLALPVHVPVERVSFDLDPAYTGNFSRDVSVHASAAAQPSAAVPDSAAMAGAGLPMETVSGTIWRVRSTQAGRTIDEAQLSVPAILGSNLQTAAHVRVEIGNGDDRPLPVAAVRLEMRQRKLCFEAPAAGSAWMLEYGDPVLAAPVYDYARLFSPAHRALRATLGPEELNPAYRGPAADRQPFTERHPEVLWIALIATVCVLGGVALRSSRNIGSKG